MTPPPADPVVMSSEAPAGSAPSLVAGYQRPAVSRPVARPAATPPGATAANPQANPAANYLRTKVLTATPEQLQLMLYDGAIRFAEQARTALQNRQYDQSYNALTRAQNILNELACGLRPEVAPELCRNLSALYTFVYLRLVDANVNHNAQSIDDALEVLRYQRETWVMLMQEMAQQRAAPIARNLDLPTADTERVERLSIEG